MRKKFKISKQNGSTKVHNTISCFSCDKELENLVYGSVEVHPQGGLHFSSQGHYGSTIFDPVGLNLSIEIAICDECVMRKMDRIRGSGKETLENDVGIILDALQRHG